MDTDEVPQDVPVSFCTYVSGRDAERKHVTGDMTEPAFILIFYLFHSNSIDSITAIATMSTADRPSKRARTMEEELHALALTLSSTLGLDAARNGDDDQMNDDDGEIEVPHLLIKTLTFLAASTELVRSRGVSRAFRRWSDSVAEARTAKLIGASVRPMLGQSVTGLLHGAERASEATRDQLRGWDDSAVRAEGFDIGIPTHKCSNPRGEVLALIPAGDLAPEARIPVGLTFRGSGVENDEGEVGTRANLPVRFFHFNAYPSGKLYLCSRGQEIRAERTLNDTLERVRCDLSNPDWSCPHNTAPYFIAAYSDDGDARAELNRELYNEYLARCCQIFSNYELGQPIPSQLELFCEEVAEKYRQIRHQQESRAAEQEE